MFSNIHLFKWAERNYHINCQPLNDFIMLKNVITAEMMSGVMDEILGVIPVALPVMIGFIALRKGIGFITSALKSA